MTDEGSGLNESFTLCLLKARERLRETQREDRKKYRSQKTRNSAVKSHFLDKT